MSLVAGQRMIRTDDGMRGVVELVTIPGYELQELRITYTDRGEKRIAGKRETWSVDHGLPRKLDPSEQVRVALCADNLLRAFDKNEPAKWWLGFDSPHPGGPHDPELVSLIVRHLQKRG